MERISADVWAKNINLDVQQDQSCGRFWIIPYRYVMAIMISIGVANGFLLRVSFGPVMKHLVHVPLSKEVKLSCNVTRNEEPTPIKVSGLQQRAVVAMEWPKLAQKDLSVAFFCGYMIGHVPAGYLADKHGGKAVLATSIGVSAVLCLLTPFAITYLRDYTYLIVIRFLVGLMLGGLFPSANSLMSQWAPPRERGSIAGIVFSASQTGNCINNYFTGEIIIKFSWPYVFYGLGSCALLWCVIWIVMGASYPQQSRFLRAKERRYLKNSLEGHVRRKDKAFPWKRMLRSIPLWALIFAQMGHTWVWHSMVRDLPRYMKDVLNVKLHKFAAVPYLLMACGTLSAGFLSDQLINRRYITLDTARKIFTTLGAMGPGIFILGASLSGCSRPLVLLMFCLAMVLMSFYYMGTRIISLDLAPNYSGCLLGLANGLGAIPGIAQQRVSTIITKNVNKNTLSEWRKLFLISLGILMVTNIFFVLFGTAREQTWNNCTAARRVTRTFNISKDDEDKSR